LTCRPLSSSARAPSHGGRWALQQTREERTQHLAERWCGPAARRDDVRGARRVYRQQVVDGVYRRDEGAWLDACFHCLHELGVGDGLPAVPGTASQRVLGPFGP
jgi:hypothetical protein